MIRIAEYVFACLVKRGKRGKREGGRRQGRKEGGREVGDREVGGRGLRNHVRLL